MAYSRKRGKKSFGRRSSHKRGRGKRMRTYTMSRGGIRL